MAHIKEKNTDYFQIGRFISVLYRTGQSFFFNKSTEFDLGRGHLSLIFHLYDHDGASQDELCKALEVDKATITRSIHKLEEYGLVERHKDANDQRVKRIVLTPSGHSHQNELRTITREWQSTLLEGFSDKELSDLHYLFDKLMQNSRVYKQNLNQKDGKG